ncbi:MAG: zf-TFIIB domain-containing protein [bacterium]|nr:zf-TFIIB domain-containing protein [bacterium]
MSSSWDDMRKAKEDEYFQKRNREAMERLAQKKAAQQLRKSPVTGKEMVQETVAGVVVDYCAESGGIFLDNGELEALRLACESSNISDLEALLAKLSSLGAGKQGVHSGPKLSPISGEPMETLSIDGLQVDRCSKSGAIWLDGGELEQLLDFGSNRQGTAKGVLQGFISRLLGL